MNEGRIEQYGTPHEVFHHPKTKFVMNFLGNVNQFRGRLVQGKVRFADMEIDAPGHDGNQTEHAAVFIRPHDLEIATEQNGHPSFAASVARIHSAGATVRLELISCSGERIAAELTHQRFEELSLTQGDKVFVTPRTVRVFGQDYVVQRRV
jgi:sulfate/thiosulfate transport system ATP-binding protein